MVISPKSIYNDFLSQKLNKSDALDLLVLLIEQIDDDIIIQECIETLDKINIKDEKFYPLLESILISDPSENLRYAAAIVIKKKFLDKAITPFLWALQHETSYNCLLILINSLRTLTDERVNSTLMEEIKKMELDKFKKSLDNYCFNYPIQNLTEILINYITILSLKKKIKDLEYQLKDGLVIELDFSKVNVKIIYWKVREYLQDYTDIFGVKNLKHLRNIRFFPLEWTLKCELSFKFSIALISAMEYLNNEIAKDSIITQLNKLKDEKFDNSINRLLTTCKSLDNLSISKLANILRNYLSILFLKKKNIPIDYKVEFGEISHIELNNWDLVSIPEVFQYFSSIRTLILKNCKIYILPDYLCSFKYLEILNLEGNNIESLPKSIGSLTSLKILNLNKNRLNKLPFSIGAFYRLKHLSLNDNKISKIPNSLGYLSSLEFLSLKGNLLNKIPDSIGYIEHLKDLVLSSNKLGVLPESIGLLRSLETLDLNKNLLTRLPSTLNLLTSLKSLNLEENQLTTISESLGTLKSLEILRLGWNKLLSLPISIGSLKSIRHIYLMNNKLKEIPDAITLLSSLETLDLTWNFISFLPDLIGNLISLKILRLNNNRLTKLPHSIGSLQKLKILNLDENKLKALPDSICFLNSLEELWLNSNELIYLPKSIENLSSLKKLLLNNNKMKVLPKLIGI